eukprot:TRINITY_DN20827_c0_g1_i1.p1 TRINITY_DN20827_c0_g1~~TRINITY_DN20827_c0_g1_i1.p1  ORF type:complete len:160 (+),score=19.52 TRINITY_DN20827_c0_g1_i1:54-482(+)
MCIRDRYQRRVHGDRVMKTEEKSAQSCSNCCLQNFFRRVDFWGFYPTFKHSSIPFKHSTNASATTSLFLSFFLAIYTIQTLYAWRTDPPTTIQQLITPPKDFSIRHSQLGIYFLYKGTPMLAENILDVHYLSLIHISSPRDS